jgi:hypothetical protein
MAGTAGILSRGLQAPLGVLSGGLLVAISYRGIKAGISALVHASSPEGGGPRRVAIPLVKFFTRYAILAVAAYVIMARLRLPPVAVVAGASSLVAAVTFEAIRGIAKPGTPQGGRPRGGTSQSER